jgi:site-specific recombinase XerC
LRDDLLGQGILKFKRRISHLLLASPPSTDDGYFPADAYDGLGTLEELEKIAQLQRERIKRMMLEEKEMGVKHSNLSRDLQSLAILSKLIMKQKEFEIAHQLDDPVRMQRLRVAGKRMNTKFMKMMRDVIPTERDKEKVIRATERFIELIDERSVKLGDLKHGLGNK